MNLAKSLNNASMILADNKEKILLVTGIALGAGATVMACRATLKAKDIVQTHKENSETIKRACEYDSDYAVSIDHKTDILMNYSNTAAQLTKMYAPAVVLGATSVCCLVAQHAMMENKVANLKETVASVTAAYIAVDTAFKNYRKRVIEKYGKEEDQRLRYGLKEEKIETVDEKGKKKKVVKTTVEDIASSDYAKFFDATSEQFVFLDPMQCKPDWDANLRFIRCQEAFAQQKLECQGYLFLNDVYDLLGFKRTKAGQVVGWIFDPENPEIDSEVKFSIISAVKDKDILDLYDEESILLDFNVDGVIIDKISKIAEY